MTAARDYGARSSTMIPPEDFALARDFIFKSTNTGKWNKPHWQAAAVAMAWFIRELPGSPMLMNRVLKLMTGHPDRNIALAEAANLIRAQFGLDASLLNDHPTSTQVPSAPGVEMTLDVSQISSAQTEDGAGAGGGSRRVLASTGPNNGAANETGRTAPTAPTAPTIAAAPAPAAVGDGVAGDIAGGDAAAAVCPAAAAATAAATARAAAAAAITTKPPRSQNANPRRSQNDSKVPGVCSYLWKRMLCRRTNCKSSHPDLCASPNCQPRRRPDCAKFHGIAKLEQDKDKSMGGANGGRTWTNQGNGQRGALPPPNSYSSRNKNSSNTRRAANGGSGGSGSRRKSADQSRKELEQTRRELRVLKGTLGTLGNIAAATGPRNHPHSYSSAVKSGLVQPSLSHGSFAATLAAAFETALSSAGLRLTQSPF